MLCLDVPWLLSQVASNAASYCRTHVLDGGVKRSVGANCRTLLPRASTNPENERRSHENCTRSRCFSSSRPSENVFFIFCPVLSTPAFVRPVPLDLHACMVLSAFALCPVCSGASSKLEALHADWPAVAFEGDHRADLKRYVLAAFSTCRAKEGR